MTPLTTPITFIVRLSRNETGHLSGIIERVKTGEKHRFHDVEAVSLLIARMVKDEAEQRARAVAGRDQADRSIDSANVFLMKSDLADVFLDENRRGEETTDEALVARCRGGDMVAFESLFQRHHARLFGLAVRILRDRQEAFDTVQETFIRAYRSLDGYSQQGSFGGWLARITANLAVDGIRHRRLRERVESQAEAAELSRLPAPGARPDQAAEADQFRRALETALERLSTVQRVVLVLKEIEGLSCKEIAVTLGCSVGTVMSRLHHGRRKLQRRLRPWGEAR